VSDTNVNPKEYRLITKSGNILIISSLMCPIQTSQLMLYSEIIAICSEIHTKHTNTLSGQNVEVVSVKHGGKYSNHWALQG
jgi:hypothetical protein